MFFFLVVLNELFLHEKVILDSFKLKLPQAALGDGGDTWQLSGRVNSFVLFLSAYSGRRRHRFFLGLLIAVVLVLFVFVNLISHIQKYFKYIQDSWINRI